MGGVVVVVVVGGAGLPNMQSADRKNSAKANIVLIALLQMHSSIIAYLYL